MSELTNETKAATNETETNDKELETKGSEVKDKETEFDTNETLTFGSSIEILLKSPEKVFNIMMMKDQKGASFSTLFPVLIFICFVAYGLIVGSFSGGIQWYAAPLKITVGLFLSALICYPSLYIFSCLSGADVKPGQVTLLLLAGIALSGILLIGFAPVAWVFSQSTNSLGFIGALHLIIWLLSLNFGMKLTGELLKKFEAYRWTYFKIWIFIFVLTSLQMLTAFRPIIGESSDFLPKEKKFFLANWLDVMDEKWDEGPAIRRSKEYNDE